MITFLRNLASDARGATAVEYGLILAMIVIAMLTALAGVANESNAMWSGVASKAAEASEKARG